VAGFRVPERSVDTNHLADLFVAAIAAEHGVEFIPGTRIEGLIESAGKWHIASDPPLSGDFDIIINALARGEPTVAGGWVVARGEGSIDDPASSRHRRDRFGVTRMGTYISIDTGKYSTAPWLAADITFSREGRAGSRIIRMRATRDNTVCTVSTVGSIGHNGFESAQAAPAMAPLNAV
jgi:hypothetical protein